GSDVSGCPGAGASCVIAGAASSTAGPGALSVPVLAGGESACTSRDARAAFPGVPGDTESSADSMAVASLLSAEVAVASDCGRPEASSFSLTGSTAGADLRDLRGRLGAASTDGAW